MTNNNGLNMTTDSSLTTEKMRLAKNELLRNRMLTPEEVVDYLQVPISWVYEKARLNEIPNKKFGKYLRFPYIDFMIWANSKEALDKLNKRKQ